jgi:hypothetical protein
MNTSDKPIDIVGPNYYNIAIPVANYGAFQELIQRGANLWPDAPPAIKEFADLVTSGRVMPDYHKQDTSKKAVLSQQMKTYLDPLNYPHPDPPDSHPV